MKAQQSLFQRAVPVSEAIERLRDIAMMPDEGEQARALKQALTLPKVRAGEQIIAEPIIDWLAHHKLTPWWMVWAFGLHAGPVGSRMIGGYLSKSVRTAARAAGWVGTDSDYHVVRAALRCLPEEYIWTTSCWRCQGDGYRSTHARTLKVGTTFCVCPECGGSGESPCPFIVRQGYLSNWFKIDTQGSRVWIGRGVTDKLLCWIPGQALYLSGRHDERSGFAMGDHSAFSRRALVMMNLNSLGLMAADLRAFCAKGEQIHKELLHHMTDDSDGFVTKCRADWREARSMAEENHKKNNAFHRGVTESRRKTAQDHIRWSLPRKGKCSCDICKLLHSVSKLDAKAAVFGGLWPFNDEE